MKKLIIGFCIALLTLLPLVEGRFYISQAQKLLSVYPDPFSTAQPDSFAIENQVLDFEKDETAINYKFTAFMGAGTCYWKRWSTGQLVKIDGETYYKDVGIVAARGGEYEPPDLLSWENAIDVSDLEIGKHTIEVWIVNTPGACYDWGGMTCGSYPGFCPCKQRYCMSG